MPAEPAVVPVVPEVPVSIGCHLLLMVLEESYSSHFDLSYHIAFIEI